MTKYLFIGGPADGERIATKDREYWEVIQRVDPDPSPEPDAIGLEPRVIGHRHVYRGRRLWGQTIYVPVQWTFEEVGARLLQHYRPGLALDVPDGVSARDLSADEYDKYVDHLATHGSSKGTLVLKVPYKETE